MNTAYMIFIILGNLIPAFLLTWWFRLLIVLIIAAAVFIYSRSRINKIRHQKDNLESQLLERSELLSYAKRDEQKARDLAEAAERNKKLLLTKISHEIRTPMNAVMGMAALLKETPLNNEQQEYTNSILHSGDNLLTLVNDILMDDILEFSKNGSDKQLETKDFDLRISIEDVLDVFAVKAARIGLDLVYSIGDGVPAQIKSDPLRLRQVLMNLVENAIRFTATGEIFIGVRFMQAKEDNQVKLEFEVRDNGIGIAAVKTGVLVKDLAQLNPSLNTTGAAGVGLIICSKLVRLMGGSINVESRENEGTTFRFTILAAIGQQPIRANINEQMAGLEGKKVLIADDNLTVRNLLKTQFENWNLAASAVGSGRQALEMLEKSPGFDLVLADLQMPGMDGIELTESIKDLYPGLPVILLNKTGDERFRKYPGLFSSVLNKPIRQFMLSEQILTGLRHKGSDSLNDLGIKQTLSVDFAKKYPFSILVAEDHSMNQLLVKRVMAKLGYEIHLCNNGQEVIEEASLHNYDLILMDVQMPVMNGLEATRMIRLCLTTQPIIIAMTANSLQGDREECLKAGMDDYISKPVKLEELVNVLEKWAATLNKSNNLYAEI